MRGHHVALSVALAGLVSCLLSGCVSAGRVDSANRRMFYGMSTSELAMANRVALRVARREGASVVARATVSGPQQAPASAHARPCRGRVLHITLSGVFTRLPTGVDHDTRGQFLSADATTGHVCETSFTEAPVMPDLDSVVLFSD